MKPAEVKKQKRLARFSFSELVSLRRRWKKRIEELNNGLNWAVNDQACKEARANKAEGIHECIVGINWLLSQKAG